MESRHGLVTAAAVLRLARRFFPSPTGAVVAAQTEDPAERNEAKEWAAKADIFSRSYDEVLAALKHQDEKLNRTLTAIAFLTAAGVTLFTRLPGRPIRFPESRVDIASFFFVVFLFAVVLALGLALAAIGPSVPFKPLARWDEAGGAPRTSRPSRTRSLIFYASIATDPEWRKYVSEPLESLEMRLARNFHYEAQTLSYRVNYKIARSRESGAFVQLTVLSLALLGVFSTERFSLRTRWWIAAALLVSLLAAPLLDMAHMHWTKFAEEDPVSWMSYVTTGLTVVLAAASLAAAPTQARHWPAVVYALAAVTASRLAFVNKPYARAILPLTAAGGLVTLVIVVAG